MTQARQSSIDPARRCARRLLRAQAAIIVRSRRGVLAGRALPLHDLRVAIRRLRTLLKVFRKALAGTSADRLERRLDILCESLGPARDTDVQIRLVGQPSVRRELSRQPGWTPFIEGLRALQARHRKRTAVILSTRTYLALQSDLRRFLNVELRRRGDGPADALERIAERAVEKAVDRVRRRSALTKTLPAEAAHRLRIACRRARYTAEFLRPILGRKRGRLARRLKAVQDALGDVHDLDVLIARLRDGALHAPPALRAGLLKRRRKYTRQFRRAWRRLDLN